MSGDEPVELKGFPPGVTVVLFACNLTFTEIGCSGHSFLRVCFFLTVETRTAGIRGLEEKLGDLGWTLAVPGYGGWVDPLKTGA